MNPFGGNFGTPNPFAHNFGPHFTQPDPLAALANSVHYPALKPGFYASHKQELENYSRDLFNKYSKANKIDFTNIAYVFADLQDRYHFKDVDFDKAKKVFTALDRDKDGNLIYEEYLRIVEKIIG